MFAMLSVGVQVTPPQESHASASLLQNRDLIAAFRNRHPGCKKLPGHPHDAR